MDTLIERFPVTHDPLWPWSLPTFGGPALVLTALLLLGAAAWSYLRSASRQRVGVVLALRLAALVLVFLALSGTSCVSRDELRVPSLVLVGVDASASMHTVKDEVGRLSRWDYLQRILADCKPTLDWLKEEHNVQVVFFKFGEEVGEFDPADPGVADGKRTDTAQLLTRLYEKYRGERYLRALIVLSDGADNVASDPPARRQAERWRSLPCPVYTVAFGSKATTSMENDIVVTSVTPEPAIVAVKGKLIVRTTIDSLGRIGDTVAVRAFLKHVTRKNAAAAKEIELPRQDVTLRLRKNNVVEITADAPADPGEYRLRVEVGHPGDGAALAGELSAANNKMSTFLSVTREGLSVLLIERQERFPEPQLLLSALAADPRIRVHVAWLRGPAQLSPDQKELFQFEKQPYDVIILGDVTAQRLREADPRVLEKIHERVLDKRTGLLMMGGVNSFGNGDWIDTPMEKMLPVLLREKGNVVRGQHAIQVTMKPLPEGLKYVLRLADKPQDSIELWAKIQANAPLNGVTVLGPPQGNALVMAQSPGGQRLLVARDYGTGRTMAFAGDTTHLWIRPGGGKEVHSRFWRQVVLWLAHQEDTDDNLRIRPDIRRLRTGDNLNFGALLRGKQGEDVKNARYQAKVIDPRGGESSVEMVRGLPGALEANESRGRYQPRLPGDYCIEVSATGKDASGRAVDARSEAWFHAYEDDAETTEKAANPDFLKDLAEAGGGQVFRPVELLPFLKQLPNKPLPNPPPRPGKFPDWRTTKGRSPFLVAYFLLFVQLLALEWFLRRRWGMV